MTVDDVVATYLKLRDKRDVMEAAVKEQTKGITEKLVKLEALRPNMARRF